MNKFKRWVLNRKFVKENIDEVIEHERIVAFKNAREDLDETNVYETDKKAEELMEKRLNSMLSVVDTKKIISIDKSKGMLLIGGEQVEAGRLKNLKAEAEVISQMDIWGILHETPKELAQKAMFVSSESLDDMKKGKSMLYLLSTQQNILDILKALKGNKK